MSKKTHAEEQPSHNLKMIRRSEEMKLLSIKPIPQCEELYFSVMLDEALLKLKIKNIINHVKMSRRLKKKEVKYISECLREIDMEVMEAFVS